MTPQTTQAMTMKDNRQTVFASITIGLVTEGRLLSHAELVGRLSGSREPSPAVSALPGFDPGRKEGGNS